MTVSNDLQRAAKPSSAIPTTFVYHHPSFLLLVIGVQGTALLRVKEVVAKGHLLANFHPIKPFKPQGMGAAY
jgi:hypothetical protein